MRRWTAPVFLGLLVVLPGGAEAQDTEWNRYTLEGLGGVFVNIVVADTCEPTGVTASEFEADVSLQLMEADVPVLTREQMLQLPALPELRVTVGCATGSAGTNGSMAYSVELRVQQSAQMLRDTQITLPEAVTWYSTRIGVTAPDAAVQTIGAALSEQVTAFSTAWTEVHAAEEGGGL